MSFEYYIYITTLSMSGKTIIKSKKHVWSKLCSLSGGCPETGVLQKHWNSDASALWYLPMTWNIDQSRVYFTTWVYVASQVWIVYLLIQMSLILYI